MESVHTIRVGDREVFLAGAPDDPFWQAQKGFDSRQFPMARCIDTCLAEEAVALDVGANIGLVTLLLAMRCRAGQIFSIEPVPENLRYLRRNPERNGIDNCTVIEVAAGRADGAVRFHAQGPYSHAVGVKRESEEDGSASLLSLYSPAGSALAGRRMSFIKIDAEGFEPGIPDGARGLIERERPWIFMEFHSWYLWSLRAYDQSGYAGALREAFEVSQVDGSGQPVPAFDGDLYSFLRHDAAHGFVDDLLLHLREAQNVPSFEEMTRPESARRLRCGLDAIRRTRGDRKLDIMEGNGAAARGRGGGRTASLAALRSRARRRAQEEEGI